MNETNIIQSFFEFASSVNNTPYLANLIYVLQKANTPFKRSILEHDVDKGIDALKDFIHSKMTLSTNYANDRQIETDKNTISAMAENAKIWVKEFLKARGLLVAKQY